LFQKKIINRKTQKGFFHRYFSVRSLAIFGIGAWYGEDVTNTFLKKQVACIGWDEQDAPSLHRMIAHIKIGDIIYIKTHPADRGLTIKAIGIAIDDKVTEIKDAGAACLRAKWVWTGSEHLGSIQDKYNVRNNTLYEEYNRKVQERVLELLLSRLAAN
jgi:hypothetical protein